MAETGVTVPVVVSVPEPEAMNGALKAVFFCPAQSLSQLKVSCADPPTPWNMPVPEKFVKVTAAVRPFAATEAWACRVSPPVNVNVKEVTLPLRVACPRGAMVPVPVMVGADVPKTPVMVPVKLSES